MTGKQKFSLFLAIFIFFASAEIFTAQAWQSITAGNIDTVAGNGIQGFGGDGGLAAAASIGVAVGVAIGPGGDLYIADSSNFRIRKVDAETGIIVTVAGNGTNIFSGDGGLATEAGFDNPIAVVVDDLGNFYIADSFNNRIRKVDAGTGIITTVAGTGVGGFSGDGGPATSARIFTSSGVALDNGGHLFIADRQNHRIRRVDAATGIITTVAGTGSPGFNGDNILATQAALDQPTAAIFNSQGDMYIADSSNYRIRQVDKVTGIITTVAGNGTSGSGGDGGSALNAQFNFSWDLAFDVDGNLLISDVFDHRVRRVDALSGIINTVAGTGAAGFGGDGGPAASAKLNSPAGIDIDASNNLFISDSENFRVRRALLLPTDIQAPAVSGSSADQNPLKVNNSFTISATIDDRATGNTPIQSAFYSIDAGPFSPMNARDGAFDEPLETVAAAVSGLAVADVHQICVKGQDNRLNESQEQCFLLAVYDPSGGYVTGGGQIVSPQGADLEDTDVTGRAVFGFVSKYLDQRDVPSGNLEFIFKVGDINFRSSSMEWLIVTGEPRARFRGIGKINDATECKFEVDSWDESYAAEKQDAFGLKIFSCSQGHDRYKLEPTFLERGDIIIHKA